MFRDVSVKVGSMETEGVVGKSCVHRVNEGREALMDAYTETFTPGTEHHFPTFFLFT